jgi:hypothetical protein
MDAPCPQVSTPGFSSIEELAMAEGKKDIVVSENLVAACGLYCGACASHRKGRCPGCQENKAATWCQVRTCCQTQGFKSCADCEPPSELSTCKKFNHFIAKIFGFVFRSDRAACVRQIRELGLKGHAEKMAAQGKHTIKRK